MNLLPPTPSRRGIVNPIYRDSPQVDPLWSDAMRIPPATIGGVIEPDIYVNDQLVTPRRANLVVEQPPYQQLEIDFNNLLYPDTNYRPPDIAKERFANLPPLQRFNKGVLAGNEYGIELNQNFVTNNQNSNTSYSKSAVFERAPSSRYRHMDEVGKAGFMVGRIGADIYGNGTRKYLWNIQPEDFTSTQSKKIMYDAGASRVAQLAVPFLATAALGIGSGNYDPTNLTEGGRPEGFSAINPGEDPRQSNSPLYDLAIERGMLGRRGRLLPWEQFRLERPDVSFEQYDKYQKYLTNKDDNDLRWMTGGLAKATLEGINGPEINVMGYSVNPIGAAVALGITLLGRQAALR